MLAPLRAQELSQLVSVCRAGAGGIRWRRRIRRIVEAPMWSVGRSTVGRRHENGSGCSCAVENHADASALVSGQRQATFDGSLSLPFSRRIAEQVAVSSMTAMTVGTPGLGRGQDQHARVELSGSQEAGDVGEAQVVAADVVA
jgi:hypothetical protein